MDFSKMGVRIGRTKKLAKVSVMNKRRGLMAVSNTFLPDQKIKRHKIPISSSAEPHA